MTSSQGRVGCKACQKSIPYTYTDKTPTKTYVLCRSPYICVYHVELISAPVTLVGERKSVLLRYLTNVPNLGLLATEFRQSEHNLFRLQVMKPLVVDVAYLLMPQVNTRLDFLSFREQGGPNIIGVEDKHPPVFAASYSMKHPRCVN